MFIISKKGLTLIEILATISIISLLFVFLIPNINSALIKSKETAIEHDLKSYADALFLQYNKENSFSEETINEYLDKEFSFSNSNSLKENPFGSKYEVFFMDKKHFLLGTHNNKKDKKYYVIHSSFGSGSSDFKVEHLDEEAFLSLIEDLKNEALEYAQNQNSNNNIVIDNSESNDNNSENENSVPQPTNPLLDTFDVSFSIDKNVIQVSIPTNQLPHIDKIEYAWSQDTDINTVNWITSTDLYFENINQSGDFNFFFKLTDSSGKVHTFSETVKLDNDSPTISFSKNGESNPSTSHGSAIDVSDNSSIAIIRYVWSTSEVKPVDGWVSVANREEITLSNKNGNYYLHVETSDIFDNYSYKVSNPFVFKTIPPTITVSKDGDTSYAKQHEVTITATDDTSVDLLRYAWTTNTTLPTTGWANINSGDKVTKNGGNVPLYLHIEAIDSVQNKTTFVSKPYYFDNSSPVINLNSPPTTDYGKSHSVPVSVTDNNNDVELEYVWTASSTPPTTGWIDTTNNTTINKSDGTGDYYLHVQATDSSGNKTVETVGPLSFDNSAPTVSFTNNDILTYGKTHETTITTSDPHSGTKDVSYVWSTSETPPTTGWMPSSDNAVISKNDGDGEYYLHVKTSDNLGNEHIVTSKPFGFDNTAPTATLSPNGSTTFAASHSTKISVTDAHSTIGSIKYIWSESTTRPTTGWMDTVNNATLTVNNSAVNKYLHLHITDSLGNTGYIVSSSFALDNSMPTVSLSLNGNANYNKSYQFFINTTDTISGVKTVEYVFTTSETTPTQGWSTTNSTSSSSVRIGEVSGKYFLHVRVTDNAGNITNFVSNPYYLDNSEANVLLSPNGSTDYKNSYIVTINATNDYSGVKTVQYNWSNNTTRPNSWTNITNGRTVTAPTTSGVSYLHVKVTDNLNNETYYVSNPYYIDTIKPSVTFSPYSSSTYKQKQTVTIDATDNLSRIEKIEYAWTTSTSYPSTGWGETTNGSSLTAPTPTGIYYLYVNITDSAGNILSTKSGVFNVDNTAPIISLNVNGDTTYAKTRSSVITSTDAHSSLYKLEYVWTLDANFPSSGWSTTNSGNAVTTPQGTGKYYLHVRAYDKANNNATLTSNPFYIDNSQKEIVLSPNGSTVAKKNHSTTINVQTEHAAITTVQYKWTTTIEKPTSGWTSTANKSTVSAEFSSGNAYLHIRSVDSAGNETYLVSSAFLFDNTPPTALFTPNGDAAHKQVQSTQINVSDNYSTANTVKYKWSDSTATPTSGWIDTVDGATISLDTVSGGYYLHLQITDNAGNVANVRSAIFVLDNTHPVISLSKNGNTTYAKSHLTNVSIDDNYSGFNRAEYAISTSQTLPTTGWTTTRDGQDIRLENLTGHYYLHIRAYDNTENMTHFISNPFYLDNSQANITLSQNGSATYAKNHTVTINATNNYSGVKTVQYYWATSTTRSTSWSTGTNGGSVTSLNGNGTRYLQVKIVDNVGNETYFVSEPFLIDSGVPTVTFSKTSDANYASTHSSKISATDAQSPIVKVEYLWTTSTTRPTSGWLTTQNNTEVSITNVLGDYYLHAKVTDEAGNIAYGKTSSFNVDGVGPVIYFDRVSTEYSHAQSPLIVRYDTENGVWYNHHAWTRSPNMPSEDEWIQTLDEEVYSATKSDGTGIFYLHAKSTDMLGNVSYLSEGPFYLDNTEPNSYFTPNGNTTYAKSHTSKLVAQDENTPITYVAYAWSNSETFPTSGWVESTELDTTTITKDSGNGIWYLHSMVVDSHVNQQKFTSKPYYFDNSAPNITVSNVTNSVVYKEHSATLTATDAHSGVDKVEYVWTNSTTAPTTGWTVTSNGSTITNTTGTGSMYLHARATDKLGHTKSITPVLFKFDSTPPTITLNPDGDTNYNKDRSVTINVSDDESAVGTIEYVWSDSTTPPSDGWKTTANRSTVKATGLTGIYYLHVRAANAAGHVGYKTSNLFKFDNTAPVVTATKLPTTAMLGPDAIMIAVSENDSGISSIKYAWSTFQYASISTWTDAQANTVITNPTTTGTYYLHVQVIDKVSLTTRYTSEAFTFN